MKNKVLCLGLIGVLLFVGCSSNAEPNNLKEVNDVENQVEENVAENNIEEETEDEVQEEVTKEENKLEEILLAEGETINSLDAPEGYFYVVTTFVEDGKDVRKAVPVPRNLLNEESDCLAISHAKVLPYLKETYPNLKSEVISSEDNPDLEILDETSLAIDEEEDSTEFVNNTVIINDVVTTGVELPKEGIRAAVESFAQSFGPMSPDKLVLTSLDTEIGEFEVYIYEYEHNSEANFSRIGVFFPLGTNMHLMQVIQEGDINSPSPFKDELNTILSN